LCQPGNAQPAAVPGPHCLPATCLLHRRPALPATARTRTGPLENGITDQIAVLQEQSELLTKRIEMERRRR
jgi:hypothetical protein